MSALETPSGENMNYLAHSLGDKPEILMINEYYMDSLGKPQKNSFLSGPATKAFRPPPRLNGHRNLFPYIKKVIFP